MEERIVKALADFLFYPRITFEKMLKVSDISCICTTMDSFLPLKTHCVDNHAE